MTFKFFALSVPGLSWYRKSLGAHTIDSVIFVVSNTWFVMIKGQCFTGFKSEVILIWGDKIELPKSRLSIANYIKHDKYEIKQKESTAWLMLFQQRWHTTYEIQRKSDQLLNMNVKNATGLNSRHSNLAYIRQFCNNKT